MNLTKLRRPHEALTADRTQGVLEREGRMLNQELYGVRFVGIPQFGGAHTLHDDVKCRRQKATRSQRMSYGFHLPVQWTLGGMGVPIL